MYVQYYCHAFGMYCAAANATQADMNRDVYRAQYYAAYYSTHYAPAVMANMKAALDSEERVANKLGTKQRPKALPLP